MFLESETKNFFSFVENTVIINTGLQFLINRKKVGERMKSILSNKLYLYLTEFFAGMSVMAVELGASRLLAPYFSSSQIVWTIIIGTIMIAMALGNIYGGRTADKNPNPDRLYKRILIAAVWIAAIPVAGKYIILGISALLIFSVDSHFLIWSAFFACIVIFVFPLFLLGTVTGGISNDWKYFRNVSSNICNYSCSWNVDYFFDFCRDSFATFHYLFYQCKDRKEAGSNRNGFIFGLLYFWKF